MRKPKQQDNPVSCWWLTKHSIRDPPNDLPISCIVSRYDPGYCMLSCMRRLPSYVQGKGKGHTGPNYYLVDKVIGFGVIHDLYIIVGPAWVLVSGKDIGPVWC